MLPGQCPQQLLPLLLLLRVSANEGSCAKNCDDGNALRCPVILWMELCADARIPRAISPKVGIAEPQAIFLGQLYKSLRVIYTRTEVSMCRTGIGGL